MTGHDEPDRGEHRPAPTAATVVDARGTLCPVPIIRLSRAAAAGRPGDVFVLLSDDPAAEHDVPAWCRLRGHALLEVTDLDNPAPAGAAATGGAGGPAVTGPGHPAGLRHVIRLGAGTSAQT